MSSDSVIRLHRLRRIPQDRRVYAFGINRKHLAVQIERGLGIGSNSVEIANVFSCCLNVIWRIGRAEPFAPSETLTGRHCRRGSLCSQLSGDTYGLNANWHRSVLFQFAVCVTALCCQKRG